MKLLNQLLLIAISLTISNFANAGKFEFSYDFTTGQSISGSFDGTLQGNLVTDISNIRMSNDGVEVVTPLKALSARGEAGGVVSFDAAANDFAFLDATYPASITTLFSLYQSTFYNEGITYLTTVAYFYDNGRQTLDSAPSPSRWSLTAVPEPETYGMLLAGVGLLGVVARRRNAMKQV